jgi:GT2 family glycosyltransferase
VALTVGAVIPTRFWPPELDPLLDLLDADGVRVALIRDDARYDHHIYRMWNAGWLRLELLGCQYVAFLNDDIRILPGTLPLMATALASRPDVAVVYPDAAAPMTALPSACAVQPTTGTWGAGGLTGFCFMVNAALPIPRFDTGYRWWFGDDAFEESVRASGFLVGRIPGLPVWHVPGRSAERDPEVLSRIGADRERWEALHR